MKSQTLLALALTCALGAACSATGSTGGSSADWEPLSEIHALEDWSLPQSEVEDLLAAIPDASQGEWLGESSVRGEGIGTIYHRDNRFSGTWKSGRLEGPFRALRRELLLAEGMAAEGVITDGTLFHHKYFQPIYSSSWDQTQTDFVTSQEGTHSLVAFRGAFKNGRPYSGRFYNAGKGYRNESFKEGTLTGDGQWQGHYAFYTSGLPSYEVLDQPDEDYELREEGLFVDGLREGRWTGGGQEFFYKSGQKNGVCRDRSAARIYFNFLCGDDRTFFGWKTTTFKDGEAIGFQRITFDKTVLEWAEYQASGDGSEIAPFGWHLIQPREGEPFMFAVANSISAAPESLRPLPEGTTRSRMAARSVNLDLGGGVTWFGPVADGKPNGFGRRFGFRPLLMYEEGWFKDGEPEGYILGTSLKDEKGRQLAYAWVDGVELDNDSGFHTRTLKDIENFELEQEQLAEMLRLRAYQYRPESERVWSALVWEGTVINPEGVVINPKVVVGPRALNPGDIVWVRQQIGDAHRSFQVVAGVYTDNSVRFKGLTEKFRFLADEEISVFYYSNTGSAFDDLAPACTYCGGTGSEVVQTVEQYKEYAREWIPGTGMVETTYLVTERTPTQVDCVNCNGSGVILNRYFGQ